MAAKKSKKLKKSTMKAVKNTTLMQKWMPSKG
jgi:hypothetical protein